MNKTMFITGTLIGVLGIGIFVMLIINNKSYSASIYLYDTVANSGKVSTYSGEHADSVNSSGANIVGSKAIYYYNTAGYNNVHFGNYCWQIVRTTDTGGVKLLYNGTYSSSTKCNNSGTGRWLGESVFNNTQDNRLYLGYKYKSGGTNSLEQSDYTSVSNSSSYPYTWSDSNKNWTSSNHSNSSSSTITFKVKTAGDYKLNYTVSSETNYDKAYFYKNNSAICSSSSGISGSTSSSCDLNGLTTSDTIKVTYTKDSSQSSGNDNVIFYLTTSSSASYNVNDSTIKTYIDNWYESNMTSLTSKLEDTVFCNDRTGSTSSSSALTGTTWAGDSSTTNFYCHFYNTSYSKLSCDNEKDKFSVNNSVAQLSYPIGLITGPEYNLLDSTTKNIGALWWLLSPYGYEAGSSIRIGDASGNISDRYVHRTSVGVRPSISLVPYITKTGGVGTVSDPYEIGVIDIPAQQMDEPEVEASNYLYDKVKEDVTTNGYGGEYTGDHADTVEDDGTSIVGDKSIYYYKTAGYNNVHFGNYCWQIVRTTDTGGVKLIYSGTYSSSTKCNNSGSKKTIGESAFNSSYSDRLYAGYKYKSGSTYNSTDSTIKTYIDNWYRNNMTSLTSKLEDTVFCNDRTGSIYEESAASGTTWAGDSSTSEFYYHNYDDDYSKLLCDNVRDRFTVNNNVAKLSFPIALITQSEYKLLDSTTKSAGSHWWLLSPWMFYNNVNMRIDYNGSLDFVDLGENDYVRPSVSLAPYITVTGGSGTVSSPYELGEIDTPKPNYMYDKVKEDATTNGYGAEYTGEHADTVEDDGTAKVGTKGIYYYQTSGHNNVKLGNFCWQIVRTTDTGGIKLIYNGVYDSTNKCNNSGTDRTIGTSVFNNSFLSRIYVGYKYKTTNYNDTNSTIKTYIDDWYSSNMTSLTSYLEDTVFCNDRMGTSSNASNNPSLAASGTTWAGDSGDTRYPFYYHTYDDNYSNLSCNNIRDRFSTNSSQAKLSYSIGLITQPEYKLLDSTTKNIGSKWWLLSPYFYVDYSPGSGARGRSGGASDTLDWVYIHYSANVRPSVSLKTDITFTGGDGSVSNPYLIGDVIVRSRTLTATFYYQSSNTSGQETVASTTVSCETMTDSCEVEIPSVVKSSVGKYNNKYAGFSSETGTMSTSSGAGKNETSITISDDTSFYSIYSSSISQYYYSN